MATVEKHLATDQSWVSQLSAKEVCVGMMWATSNNMTHILARLLQTDNNNVFKHKVTYKTLIIPETYYFTLVQSGELLDVWVQERTC